MAYQKLGPPPPPPPPPTPTVTILGNNQSSAPAGFTGSGANNNIVAVKKIVAPTNGLIHGCEAFIGPVAGASDGVIELQAALSLDNAGAPGVIIGAGGTGGGSGGVSMRAFLTHLAAGRWVSAGASFYVTAGTYWLWMLLNDNTSNVFGIGFDAGGGDYVTTTTQQGLYDDRSAQTDFPTITADNYRLRAAFLTTT